MCDVLDAAEQRGEVRGISLGISKGIAEEKAIIMRKMYEKGYVLKEIVQITDESEETIKNILHLV